MINFDGIDIAVLVHALYHGTHPLGMGVMYDQPGLTVEQVREDVESRNAFDGVLHIDYFHGRPLKVALDLESKTFDPRLYNRDAGPSRAEEIVLNLRAAPDRSVR